MPDPDLRLIRRLQKKASNERKAKSDIRARISEATAELGSLDLKMQELEARGQLDEASDLKVRITAARADRRVDLRRVREVDERLAELLRPFADDTDPCDADPKLPLLLLPVRVETRYRDDKSKLRVRIYPDDIHIDQLDRGLNEDERSASENYWTKVGAAQGSEHERESAAQDAWAILLETVGAKRATWVALALTPKNLDAWQMGSPAEFPKTVPRTRQAAIARMLPDRFVVVAQQGRSRSEARGALINSELVAGLLAEDGTDLVEVGGAKVPEGAEWMIDYDRAKAVGLAIDLDLTREGKIDRLFVVGVRRSLDADDTASEFADLLTSHRCSRGLAFVPQGSPSNNTDDERSEWQNRPQPESPDHLFSELPASTENSAVLAEALGLDPRSLQGVAHADDRDQALSQSMNQALWPATWGTFLNRLTTPDDAGPNDKLSDRTINATRDFFQDQVKGRGPLPTLRVGKQPYGILPVSDLRNRRWKKTPRDKFEGLLQPLMNRLRQWWDWHDAKAPHLGSGAPIDETLLEILGLSPIAMGLRVRTVVEDGASTTVAALGFDDSFAAHLERDVERILYLALGLDPDSAHASGSLEAKSRPLPFPMVHESDPEFIRALLDGKSIAVKSILQALVALSWDSAERAVRAAAPKRDLQDLFAQAQLEPLVNTQVLALAGRADQPGAKARDFHLQADRLADEVGEVGPVTLKSLSPVAGFRESFAEVAAKINNAASKAQVSRLGTAAWLRAQARKEEVREGLTDLLDTGLETRKVLFAETIDLCSHRLDAWMTGFVDKRRRRLRSQTPQGLVIGAFAWLENIEPGRGAKPDGGYIHAPTLNHAATAGILRSAYLNHNADANGDKAFAIDLSSERVRTALHLVDGIRQGQSLSALLGYRIERALHEDRLDRLILTLRGLAPLIAGRLNDRDDAVPDPAIESIAANNVIDGLELIEKFDAGGASRSAIRTALNDPPKDNPYIAAGDWPPLSIADWNKVQAIIRDAASANDAAADLLLAESVHQLVLGNTARASSALSTAGGGDTPPPEPDVIRTPSDGVPISHRALLFVSGAASTWNALRPRALASPELESWAATRLGDPANIVVATLANGDRLNLNEAGLCALDFIYDSASPLGLEQRIRAALVDLPEDVEFAEFRSDDWPAAQRGLGEAMELAAAWRDVIVNAQPAQPSDLSRPSDPTAREFSSASLAALETRASAALGLLNSATEAMALAVEPPAGDDGVANFDSLAIANALEDLAAFGAVNAAVQDENIVALGKVALAEAQRRVQRAESALAEEPFDANVAKSVGQELFGDGFWLLPAIDPPVSGDLLIAARTTSAHHPPRAARRRFLRDLASVRRPLARLSRAHLLSDALGRPANLEVAQLSAENLPWLGDSFGLDQASPEEPVCHLLLDAQHDDIADGQVFALSIDQWTDVLPARLIAGEDNAATTESQRASGIAINAAAASSRPPQTMLLAVSPDGKRWTTDALVATLDETLERAKMRTITLERAFAIGRVLPALYQRSWSLQGEKVFDFRLVAANPTLAATLAFVKDD